MGGGLGKEEGAVVIVLVDVVGMVGVFGILGTGVGVRIGGGGGGAIVGVEVGVEFGEGRGGRSGKETERWLGVGKGMFVDEEEDVEC